MAIRVRQVNGVTIALCAVESDPKPGDLYLDDAVHYALAAKFAEDWKGQTQRGGDPRLVELMQKEKVRDAQEEIERWLKSQNLPLFPTAESKQKRIEAIRNSHD